MRYIFDLDIYKIIIQISSKNTINLFIFLNLQFQNLSILNLNVSDQTIKYLYALKLFIAKY